jgi:hypothetical protein
VAGSPFTLKPIPVLRPDNSRASRRPGYAGGVEIGATACWRRVGEAPDERREKGGKCLKLLALPRGIEPCFGLERSKSIRLIAIVKRLRRWRATDVNPGSSDRAGVTTPVAHLKRPNRSAMSAIGLKQTITKSTKPIVFPPLITGSLQLRVVPVGRSGRAGRDHRARHAPRPKRLANCFAC